MSGEAREQIVDGISGRLVALRDLSGFVEAIRDLFNNISLSERITKQARDSVVKGHSPAEIVEEWVQTYHSVRYH